MKILRKRFLAWGMTLCMICGLLPMMAFATEHQHDESCGYVAAVECSCGTEDGTHAEGCSYNPGAECTYVAPQETEEPTEEPVVPAAEDEPTTEPLADKTFTVTYTDGVDGEEIFADQVYTVEAGGALPYFDTSIGSLEREGFTYQGWTPNLNYTVTADATYTAVWTVDNTTPGFTVTYTDGVADEEIFEDLVYTDVESGAATPIYEGTPNRAGYTFAGWSPEVAATVTGNATYTAQWTADEPDTPEPLTISVSHAYLIGGGTITITTSKPANQVTADFEDGLIEITTNNKINWTATIPDHILGRTHFIATDENGSVASEDVYLSPTFWINPTSETLTGGGTVTLVTAVPVSTVTCDAGGINVQGSGDAWAATLPNSNATYTFTANLDDYTANCTVSVVKGSTITFHGNSGGGSMEPIVVKEGEQVTLPACSFTAPDGFIFAYWSTKANGTETRYESGKILKPSADMTLYAIWKAVYVTDNSSGSSSRDDDDSVSIPVIGDEDETTTKVTVKEINGIYDIALEPIPDSKWDDIEDGEEVEFDFNDVIEKDAKEIVISIPGTTVKDMAEETNADLKISTPIADVNIDNDTLAENKGKLVMETERTKDGISAKVSIGGVSVIDTGVKLPVGVDLPEDGKLVVGTLQPGADALNFLPLTETTEPSTRMAMVPEDIIKSTDAAVIGPDGGSYTQHEKLLINGKEYYVSGSGDGESLSLYDKEGNRYSYDGEKDPQVIGQDAGTEYPENEFISINGATYQIHSVQRDANGNGTLILYLDGKPAGMCQFDQYEEMDSINIYNEDYAPDKVSERQQNSKYLGTVTTDENPIDGLLSGKTYNVSVIGSQDISVPGAENVGGTVTQTFDIPVQLVDNPNAKYAAVHVTNPHAEALEEAFNTWRSMREKLHVATHQYENGEISLEELNKAKQSEMESKGEYIELVVFYDTWEKEHAADNKTGNELGTVTISEDGKTLTATYTVSSFSPFTIYAFTEADEPEIKVIGSGYRDVSMTDWYYPAVRYVSENGLMSGTDTGVFSPAEKTTRGMIVTILNRMEGKPEAGAVPFTDVKADMYYAEAIAWAAAEGIVSGYGDTFGPNDPITREQLASILWRYAKYKGYDVSVGEDTNILSYEDAFDISEYAIPAMQWACGAGIISGNTDGTLHPDGHAQRSHAAQMLMKFDKNVK